MLRYICFFLLLIFLAIAPQPSQAKTLAAEIAASREPVSQAEDDIAKLRIAAFSATNRGDFATAEGFWTRLIDKFPENAALWSNRGNARVSQKKLPEAIADYDRAIELAPEEPDPYLNRGVAWEGLQQWDRAIADYRHILKLDPKDAIAYNNLGNAHAGMGDWPKAVKYYHKAVKLAPDFAFARDNYALALYQNDRPEEAIKEMKNVVRRYPEFPDMRAALTAVLWQTGHRGEAESNWIPVLGMDVRYRNLKWLAEERRWPPKIVAGLGDFLKIN
jgi:tetratricopeptide (TPR) repeat protein